MEWVKEYLPLVAGIVATVAAVLGGFFVQRAGRKHKDEYSSNVEAIASAVKAVAPVDDERREEEREIVRRLVNEYHGQALAQAKVQFWFSVIAASCGFLIIIVGIWVTLSSHGSAVFQSTLQVLPGIAIEAVAALFFKQAAETRERATALYDRLRTDRERANALTLLETIDNTNLKDAIKAEIAIHMAGLSQTHLVPRLLADADLKLKLETENIAKAMTPR
ncbi:MAG: hypothetical protein QOG23_3080 [Blastocatellia bacterium]|jgi:hypothetical protein|nr:hypothetical protein [Blastocatellia bacterium]